MKTIRVLAVGDPAVDAYTRPEYGILPRFEEAEGIKVDFDIVPWDSYYGTLMDAFSGTKQYDIVMVAGHLCLLKSLSLEWLVLYYCPLHVVCQHVFVGLFGFQNTQYLFIWFYVAKIQKMLYITEIIHYNFYDHL